MTRMANLSRRAVLRLGAGAVAGAAGAFTAGRMLDSAGHVAGPDVAMAGVGAPLAPPAPLEPAASGLAAPTMVTGSFGASNGSPGSVSQWRRRTAGCDDG